MYSIENKKIDIAKSYCQIGFKVFPVHSIEEGKCTCGADGCKDPGKHPITTSGFKDATNDPQILQTYFGGEYDVANIGLATGEQSGVWVLNIDGSDGLKTLKEWELKYGSLPVTVTAQTGAGEDHRHLFFKFEEGCVNKKNSVKFAGGLDVRFTGGYVILPPSKHKSGRQYKWIFSPSDIPFAPAPAWLLDLIPDRDSEPTVKVKEPVKETVKESNTFKIEKETSLQDRCALYLEKTPEAISGEGRQNASYAVCCRVVELFGKLSDGELFQCLEAWNKRCHPPWTEKELRRKIAEARKRVQGVNGCRVAATPEVNPPSVAPEPSVEPSPSLSEAAYHGLAGRILNTLDPITEADPASILMSFLTAFGITVGRNPHYVVEGTNHHANLFVALVGQSSRGRKGVSLGRVLELLKLAPVKQLSGISTGEGLIAEVKDADVLDKRQRTVLDKRRWIVEGELARLLQAMKREGNTLSAILRDIWDTGNLYNLTKNTPLTATNAHIGLTAHITAEELKKLLGSTEVFNGFGNRFLWCYVKRSKWLPDERSVDLSPLQKEIATVVSKSKEIGKMTRSAEAATLWRQVYFALGQEKRGTWDAVTSRAEAQVVRLSILYALLDSSAVIEVEHLKAALAVWNYCDNSAKLLFDDPDSMDRTILEIVSNQPGIKKSEVRLQFSHNRKGTEEFNTALAVLVRREEILVVTVKGQGRQADLLYPGKTGGQGFNGCRAAATPEVNSPEPPPSFSSGGVTPATLAELFDWKNQNIVKFEKREGGEVRVTPEFESKLTPSIEEAIRRNQSIVSAFVTSETVTREDNRPNALEESSETVKPSDEVLTNEEWEREMAEM